MMERVMILGGNLFFRDGDLLYLQMQMQMWCRSRVSEVHKVRDLESTYFTLLFTRVILVIFR